MAGVVFDSTFLIDLLNPGLGGDKRAALDFLVAELAKAGTRILIPTPCLTELLMRAAVGSRPISQIAYRQQRVRDHLLRPTGSH